MKSHFSSLGSWDVPEYVVLWIFIFDNIAQDGFPFLQRNFSWFLHPETVQSCSIDVH